MPTEHSAGAVIYRKEGDTIFYLLLHYPSGARTKNDYWDFPKGRIGEGEDVLEAAKREVKEETGLSDIEFAEGFRGDIKYFFKFQNKTIFKTVVFYLAETKTKEVKISFEHAGFKWLPHKEALEQLNFKNAKAILEQARDFLGGS